MSGAAAHCVLCSTATLCLCRPQHQKQPPDGPLAPAAGLPGIGWAVAVAGWLA